MRLNVGLVKLLLLLVVRSDGLVVLGGLLFGREYFVFILGSDLLNIRLLYFLLLYLTHPFKKLPLILQFTNHIPIHLNLFLVLFNVFLYPQSYIGRGRTR